MLKAPLVLFALDYDEAGNKAFRFWKETYSNFHAWPVPKGKAPCDTLKAEVDLNQWLLTGIEYFKIRNLMCFYHIVTKGSSYAKF